MAALSAVIVIAGAVGCSAVLFEIDVVFFRKARSRRICLAENGQLSAVFKGVFFYFFHSRRDFDAGQTGAAGKRSVMRW